jgi:hypothetical protein
MPLIGRTSVRIRDADRHVAESDGAVEVDKDRTGR